MAKTSEIIKELQDLSNQISVQVRTIALSLLALSWGLLVGTAPVHLQIDPSLHVNLVRVGLVAILVLLLDFLQYLFGYWDTNVVLGAAEASNLKEAQYNPDSMLYRLRKFFFYAKIVTVLVGFVYLVILLLPRVA